MNQVYLMDKKTYRAYTTGEGRMSRKDLINYINDTFGLRGKVVKIRIKK